MRSFRRPMQGHFDRKTGGQGRSANPCTGAEEEGGLQQQGSSRAGREGEKIKERVGGGEGWNNINIDRRRARVEERGGEGLEEEIELGQEK
ncbi:hypothetical protein FOCC_FOCC013514, partial [Frankliniella occidentalis]